MEPSAADLCTNPPKAEGKTLTFASYGGAYQEAQCKGWLEPYAALTGIKFQESEESANAQIKAHRRVSPKSGRFRLSMARPTGVERPDAPDAIDIRIPIEGAEVWRAIRLAGA